MKILLATNNGGKIERFKHLLKQVDSSIELLTPKELGIEIIDVEENGATLAENAELKARAYFGKVDIPILSNDTGFYVEGEGFVDAPKRKALGETNESSLTQEEITKRLLSFWKGVATKYGGKVDAAWVETFVAIHPDGNVEKADSRREIVLTDQEFGKAHPQMPVRALYYSKTTNKPSIQHTEEEEILELKPITDALAKVLRI
jgi:inosine/xanthosine triphosphate pyrophosphatase family protein